MKIILRFTTARVALATVIICGICFFLSLVFKVSPFMSFPSLMGSISVAALIVYLLSADPGKEKKINLQIYYWRSIIGLLVIVIFILTKQEKLFNFPDWSGMVFLLFLGTMFSIDVYKSHEPAINKKT